MRDFKNQHILSARDFTREEIDFILEIGKKMVNNKYSKLLDNKIMAALFFEPSTRTRLSFESAMLRLGGKVIGFQTRDVSSVKKGESIADTIRTVENYSDVIVIRHPLEGVARMAAKFSSIPIINGGSGSAEHPTQALLDLFTIKEECGTIDGLNIGLCGDLKYGRTVHSLAYLFSNYNINLYLISPASLKMRFRITDWLYDKKMKFKETEKFKEILPILDILYMTRIQEERFLEPEEYEKVKDVYILTKKDLDNTKENFRLMHPLPRVGEISPDIDKSPKAIYFKQMKYGLYLRMALLALVLKGNNFV
ncbi:MAG: aspartate carbamoyltransferase [Candidatus Lokiarchaeota archaeon]|nr:aspartate carbamoyltransferase [Candidatus Lokiarchaeota archaeon]